MPTYNSSQTLRCALRSLCRQTFADFEAWVVGDACTDDSEQVVASCADSRLHWTNLIQHFGCQSWPNNEGLRRARGRYIAYLGHDDLWFPWHLASLVTTIEQTGADFVHAAAALMDRTGPVGMLGAPGGKRSYAYRVVVPSSWLHRREIVENCGGWQDPQGQISAVDSLFQRRAFRAGHRFAASGQLSVLKFPSTWWRAYSLKRGHPQPAYMDQMEQDPVQLHQQLLTELAFALSRPQENGLISHSLALARTALKAQLREWYGMERWPLSQYLAWRCTRRRKQTFILRGLGDKPPAEGRGRKDDSALIPYSSRAASSE